MSDIPVKTRLCFIVNPNAGKRKKPDYESAINTVFNNSRFIVDIHYTGAKGHAKTIAKKAVDSNAEIIVAVGGDGTVNEVASELIGTNILLGIVPTGSGNGLARHLKIPVRLQSALEVIKSRQYKRIDTAVINNYPFVSIAGIGFDAHVAREFEKNKQRGFMTYFSIVTSRYLNYISKKYKLHFLEGIKLNVRAFFISFANSNQFGYNTTISPNAKLDDGLLDVCIVTKPKLIEIPGIINLLLFRKIDRSERIDIIQSKGLSIKRKKSSFVNIDGEPVKMGKKLNIELNPLSLNIIIPENGIKK